MRESDIRRILEDLGMQPGGEEAARALRNEDLVAAVDRIREKAHHAATPDEASRWMRDLAGLLAWFAAGCRGPEAGRVATMAAALYERDLADPAGAEGARLVAAVRSLDPAGWKTLYERFGGLLDADQAIVVLEVLASLAPEGEREQYAALLQERRGAAPEAPRRESRPIEDIRALVDRDPEEALKVLERVLEKAPAHVEALRLIARVLVATGRRKKVEAWYARALASAEGEASRTALLLDLGKLQLELLGEPSAARSSFEGVLEADPTQAEALVGLVQACEALGRLEDALTPVEKARVASAGRPEEARVLPVVARLQSRLGRVEEAERTWRRLRAVDPRNADALRFYEEYHEAAGDYQKLFTTLQFALSVVEDPGEKVRINRKMAEVAEHRLNNLERALEAHKRILAIAPLDEEAQAAVVALYEKTRKWHALIEFYNERLRRLPEDAIEERVATLFRIIEIYQDPEKLPSEDNVLATYARIAEVSPTNRQALETLARGYESRERWPDLLRVLQKQVAVTEDPVELLELFHRIAEIAITRMSNETQAIPFLERILELDPQNLEVVKKLKDIYRRKHNQERLFAMHLKELPMLEGAEREQVLASAAAMARDRLLRYDEALRLYEELYQLNPNSREARENLHVLYARLEKWADYARFLREEVARPMPAKRRTELRHRLGEILLDRLGDLAGAREVYEGVLAEDPGDDLAVRRLEQLYLEQEDIEALRAMFGRRGDMRSFVALLAQRDAREKDPERRVLLNLAMARACEEDLREPARAVRFLETAWSLDRSLVDVARRLLDLHEAAGNIEAAVALLKDMAPALEDPAERMRMWERLHRHLERLGRPQEAFAAISEAVRQALSSGQDPDALIEAARNTATNGALWHEYAALLREAGEVTMEPARRLRLFLELGEVLENRLLFHDDARAVLQQVLDLDPGNLTALGLLEDIALQLEDYTGLEQVLRRRIDVAADPEQARDIRQRLGRLYEDLLGDDAAAADCYIQVLQTHPEDREALGGLHRTYERSERYLELADVIRMEIASAETPRERARLQCDLARLCWESLDDYDEALRLLQAALASDEADQAVAQLQTLFDNRLARDAAANILAPYFRASERFADLLALLRARAEDPLRPEARAALYMEIADIEGRIQGDAWAAFDAVATAVSLFPSDVYVDRLLEMAEATGRHTEAAVVIGRWVGILPEGEKPLAATLPDAGREATLCLRLGRLYAGPPLDRPDLAIRAYEKALPFEEEDEGLLRLMLDLYRRLGDTPSVLATYDRLAGSLPDGEARRSVLIEKAGVAREAGEADQAIEALERVLDTRPDDPEAAVLLEDILSDAGRFEDLVRVLERKEQVTSDPARRADVLYQIATIRRDRLGDAVGAADGLRRCLVEYPDHEDARLAAEATILDAEAPDHETCARALLPIVESVLRERATETDRLVAVLAAKARLARSPWDRAVAYSDVARLEEARGALDRAYEAAARAFLAMPEDQGLLDRTVEVGRKAGVVPALVDLLEGLARQTRPAPGEVFLDADAKVRLLLTAARLCREDLADLPRAAALYEELLELQPGSIAVLREMDALLHQMGREAERIPLLREMAANAISVDDKRAIHLSIGDLCRATGDLDGAVRAFQFAVERRPVEATLDPIARDAADRLLVLYEALGRVRQLADLRLLLGRTAEDPEAARGHLLLAGILIQEELKDATEASHVFEELLRRDPSDAVVLERAKALAREMSDLDRLRGLIEQEVAHARDAVERVESLIALAEVLEEQGDRRVLEPLRQVLAEQPAHPVARERVAAHLQDADLALEAARILEDAALRSQDGEVLALALASRVAHAEDVTERVSLRLRLAACLKELGRDEQARDTLIEAHRESPDDGEVYQRLVDGLRAAGRLADLVAITKEAVTEVVPDRLGLRMRAAMTLMEAGLHEGAVEVLDVSVAEEPRHRPTLDLLWRAFEALGRYDALLRTLDAMAEATESPEEQAALYERCARLADEELGDAALARAYFWKVLGLFPLHDATIPRLTALLGRAGDRAGLRELYEHELSHLAGHDTVGDQVRKAELRRYLAVMALEDGREDEAVAYALDLLGAPQPSPEDLVTARRVYAEAGCRPDLFHVLADALTRTVDREGLLDLWRFAAGMDLEDPTREVALRAAVALEKTLGEDPTDDLAALLGLCPEDRALREDFEEAGRQAGRLPEVVARLETLFAEHQDEPLAGEIARDLARILRDDLKRDEEAADYLRVALLRRPEDRDVVHELAAQYEKLSRFGDLALLYENLGDLAGDPDERLALYFRAFEIIRTRMKDPAGAAEVLRKILDQDPESRTALDALEAIARETGDPSMLAQALARKAEVSASPEDRRRHLLELASVREGPLGDVAGAIRTLEEVLESDPGNAEAIARLKELYVQTERYADLADLFEREAEVATDLERKTGALKKAAAVHESRLGDREGAMALLRRVLDMDPLNQFAGTRLGELLEAAGDFHGLVDLLQGQLSHADSAGAQADLHARIGAICESSLNDPARAAMHYRAALSLDPYRAGAREGLERMLRDEHVAMDAALALEEVYESSGEYLKLCEVLQNEVDLVKTAGEREALWLRVAEVQAERLGDARGALESLAAALALNPANADTLERLERLALKTGETARLFEVLHRLAGEARDADVRSRLNRRAAEVADRDLKDAAAAAAHYAAYLEDNPGDAETLAVLDRLYSDLGHAERLADVLRQRIGLAGEGAAGLDLRMRLGDLLATRLQEAAGAVEQYRIVLAQRPGDREAVRRLSNLVDHPVARCQAIEILIATLRESGDDEGLAWALEKRLAQIESGDEGPGLDEADPLPLHEEAAEVARRLGRPDDEMRHLGMALGLASSHEALRKRFLDAADRTGRYDEAYEYLARAASRASWADLERTLRLHAARMADRAGGRDREVEAELTRVLEMDPTCREAIEILERLFEKEGRAGDLVDVLTRKLRLDMTSGERVATLRRLAGLHRVRRERDRAIRALEEASSLEPGDTGLLEDLVALYEEEEDARGLVSALERLAAASVGGPERGACLLRVADLLMAPLQDRVAARGVLESLLSEDPGHVEARRRLRALCEDLQDWPALLAMLGEVVSDEGQDPGARVEAAMKAASVAETHQEDLAAAASFLEKAHEIDPEFLPVVDELIRVHYRSGDWQGLLRVLRRKAALVPAVGEKVALLAKACDLARGEIGDAELAGSIAREILALDPANPRALLVTARLMEAKGEAQEALDLFRRLARTTGDIEERVEALLGVARILMGRLGAGGSPGVIEEVREALRTAARFKPDHPEVNTLLRRLYLENREFLSVVEVMQRDLKRARTDAERATICMDIAEIFLNELNDGAAFLRWAEEAHRYKRDDPRIVAGIVNFHLKSGDAGRAVPHLEWLVNYLEGKRRLKELPPYAFELGRIFEGRGEVDKAIQYYRMCHEHDAGNVPNALALGRLYLGREEYEKALRVYQPLMVRLDSLKAPVRVEVLLALAHIHEARGDKKKARQYVLRVLAEEPDNADAQALLAKGL